MNKQLIKTTSILILTSFITCGSLPAQAQDDKRSSSTDDGRSTRTSTSRSSSSSTQRRRSPRLTREQMERIRNRRSSRGYDTKSSVGNIQSRGDYAGKQRYDNRRRPRYGTEGRGRGSNVNTGNSQEDSSRGGRGTNVVTQEDRERAKEEAVTRKLDEILKRLDDIERLVRTNSNGSSAR